MRKIESTIDKTIKKITENFENGLLSIENWSNLYDEIVKELKILKRLAIKRRNKMPLTAKGKKIMKAMVKQYGAKKAKQVFYASINEGKITGAEGKKKKKK